MQSVMVPLTVIALIIDICLVVFATTRPDRSRTTGFTLLCIALLIYALGYLVELLAQTPEAALTALQIENFAIPLIAPFFLLTTINLFSPAKLNTWYIAVVFSYGLCILCLVLTNNYHMQYYTSVNMVFDGRSYLAQLGQGPLKIVPQIVTFVTMVAAYIIMAIRYMHGTRKVRRQMLYFIVGSIIGFSANLLQFFGLFPAGLDIIPFALAMGLMLFSIALVRDGLMDVVVYALNTAVETMGNGFIVLDNDADFLYCNQSAKNIFPQLASFQGTESIYSLENWPAEEGLDRLIDERETAFEQTNKEGETHFYEASIRKIYTDSGKPTGWAVVVRDTTDEIQFINQLEEQATTDPLTGVLNRRQFYAMTERELEAAKRRQSTTALILFDLDHFKQINDTYGHKAGDKVLQETAWIIQSELRIYDIFGRIGGEEFVVFTQSAGEDHLARFTGRLREKLESTVAVCEGEEIRYTASFGIVEIPPGGELDLAMSAADTAMYKAKKAGRNRVAMGTYKK
ncbi:MAG: diguanylate cyclase [Christensenellaceae bacterium]|jgi:diguanylate cyclase (GGDEF)-like protein